MLRQLLEYLNQNAIDPRSPVLAAVSGGLDSMAMAHLLFEAGTPLAVAHCNFCLRGAASDADEVFVRDWAASRNIPFFSTRFDTQTYADEKSVSIQMAARALRYEWFEQLRRAHGYRYTATAHHLNDSAETLLLNLSRGTGLKGLTGIQPVKDALIRPLLFATRKEIAAYVAEKAIAWREDESNEKDDYTRNYIRRHIVPEMERLNPHWLVSVEKTMRVLKETEQNYRYLLSKTLHITPESAQTVLSLEKAALGQAPAPEALLFDLLSPYGFTEEQARQVAQHLDASALDLVSQTDYQLRLDRKNIRVTSGVATDTAAHEPIAIGADDLMRALPDGARFFMTGASEWNQKPENEDTALVDGARVKFPLSLRPWRAGDVFQPLGMHGKSQKLQDFFVNRKLSRAEKEQAWVLENGDGNIIWLPGLRLDERFKITPQTREAIRFTWIKPAT